MLPGGLMEDMLGRLGYGPYRVPDTTNQVLRIYLATLAFHS